MSQQKTKEKKIRLKRKIRSKISGTAARPRLTVSRSNKNIYAQLIDDVACVTIVAANDMGITKGTKIERAQAVGKKIAELAVAKKITAIVFDRNGYNYAGRVQALADSARSAGLSF